MGPKIIFLIFTSIQFIFAQDESCDGQIIEKQLCMSADYQNTIAPSNVTKIWVNIYDIYIIEVNIKEQALTVGFDYYISWIDPRVKFITEKKSVVVATSKMAMFWTPILKINNLISSSTYKILGETNNLAVYPPFLDPNAYIGYSAIQQVKFACKMDFADFPFDAQNCKMQVSICTVWKIKNFTVTQILREIIFL